MLDCLVIGGGSALAAVYLGRFLRSVQVIDPEKAGLEFEALTPASRVAAIEQRLEAMLQAVQTVEPALQQFYGSLSDEQKERFNRRAPARG